MAWESIFCLCEINILMRMVVCSCVSVFLISLLMCCRLLKTLNKRSKTQVFRHKKTPIFDPKLSVWKGVLVGHIMYYCL